MSMVGIATVLGFSIKALGEFSWDSGVEKFEVPGLSANRFDFRPSGSPWTISERAGISLNQIRQTFPIQVNNMEVAAIAHGDSTYQSVTKSIFTVANGMNRVGLNPLDGNTTPFVDALVLEKTAGENMEPVKVSIGLRIKQAPPAHPEGSALLTWWGIADTQYRLTRSFDFLTWTPIGAFTGQSDFISTVDEEVVGEQQAFWRVEIPVSAITPTVTAIAPFVRTPIPVQGGGFEDDFISDFEYNPNTVDWTITGEGGIAKNESAFTVKNPRAPEGSYVAFLQNEATFTGSVTIQEEGLYRLHLRMAQRQQDSSTDRQRFRVTLGGMEDEFEPGGSDYEETTSRPRHLSVGSHPLVIHSINPHGGDNTVLLDEMRIEPLLNWNDPSSWLAGTVPEETDNVYIPRGCAICLAGDCTAATIRLEGELLTAPIDTTLTARWVMVSGREARMEVGTHRSPFEQKFTLTLIGSKTDENVMGAGTKFLMAMNGGLIDLHGSPRVSWTKLGATADSGSTRLKLREPVNWQIGDKIVIAPSGLNSSEAELATIVSKPGPSTLTLDRKLAYRHFGGPPQTYTRPSDNKIWTLDQRAEVGLLTHNVKVQGDSDSELRGFGGHLMIMQAGRHEQGAGFARLSNIELYRLGQKSLLARYPMHWHMQGSNGQGQFIEDSSIHRSFNRAVTIHGTESARVERVVAYDHIGHGIFLEDGSERYNKIYHNLALLTRRPAPGAEVIPTDNSDNEEQNRTPATYWITNPNNEFVGNVAAGTVGTGFWFALHQVPTGLSSTDRRFQRLEPTKEPLGVFRRNVAHSCMSALDINDQIKPDLTLQKNGEWANDGPFYFDDLTLYSNRTGLYAGIGGQRENVIYRNNVLADNLQHSFLATYQKVFDSVIVADSGNQIIPVAHTRNAIVLYDGAARTEDCHLVGFDAFNATLTKTIGAATKHPNALIKGLTYDHPGPPRAVLPNFNLSNPDYSKINSPADPRVWGSVIRDLDGTTTGTPGRSIIGNHTFMMTGDEVQPDNWVRVYHTGNQFAHLRLSYSQPAPLIPDTTWIREKIGTTTKSYFYGFKVDGHQQMPVIVNSGFTYSILFASNLPNSKRINIAFDDASRGDNVFVKLLGISNLPGLNVTGMTRQTSLTELRDTPNHSYYRSANGDLWLKFLATDKYQLTRVSWK